jgi:hypothetical protein
MEKGFKGLTLYHESEYFKERTFFHKNNKEADSWLLALKSEAKYYDFNKKYDRGPMLGKGKFSIVYRCKHRETEEILAMKHIDKN